jgi:hypothetical protein
MLPLKQRTIWKKDLVDAEKNRLIARVQKEQAILKARPTPAQITRTLEIYSPTEDRRGQTIKKRMRITVDSKVLQEIKEAISTFAQLPAGSPARQDYTIEVRCECSRRLMVTRESPAVSQVSQRRIQYVIGDGADVRFVLDYKDLDRLLWDLENAMT